MDNTDDYELAWNDVTLLLGITAGAWVMGMNYIRTLRTF
jgi:hypothetical protein